MCSTPPSDVGTGMVDLDVMFAADVWVRGRKYMYICVVNRRGRFGGVIQRVKGCNDSFFMLVSHLIKFLKEG